MGRLEQGPETFARLWDEAEPGAGTDWRVASGLSDEEALRDDMPNEPDGIQSLYKVVVYKASRQLGDGITCNSSLIGGMGLLLKERDG